MASNYAALRKENELRYGTDIGLIGPMLLANRYGDRTHFVYELLQNAEDALARRDGDGSRAVRFELSSTELRVSHFGVPFTPKDVEGVCGIGKSTKAQDLTAIGRFGIGFKSVYAYTNRPEIHSGEEHFAIDSFVWPTPVPPYFPRQFDETVFVFPFQDGDSTSLSEITEGLQRLGPRVLLFLREINEIFWSVKGGTSGRYMRREPKFLEGGARKTVLIDQESGQDTTEESWLVFSQEVRTEANTKAGHVEIAFALQEDDNGTRIEVVDDSNLVVFFPTIVPTHLGFLVQGPYRTTPSRDNVPPKDEWNQHLATKTAELLVESLKSLRDIGLLDVTALRTLPLERLDFGEKSLLAPLFDAVQTALSNEKLLPQWGGGYVSAEAAVLARTQELRDLLPASQLAHLLQRVESAWLSEEITQDRNPELRRYLMQELEIAEFTPETLLPRFTQSFLEAQSDEWIVRFYEFSNGQLALLRQRRFVSLPFVRLQNGAHIAAKLNDEVQAFLPSSVTTDFPTVRAAVCATAPVLAFLRALGLDEPDPVDDVVRNVLPKYSTEKITIGNTEYAADIGRFLQAFATDSKAQREKLIEALRGCRFLQVIHAGDGSTYWASPDVTYLSTPRLKELFEGVRGVFLINDSFSCLQGESVRDLLEACGAARYLQPIETKTQFPEEKLQNMRLAAGWPNTTGNDRINDNTLRGLNQLLKTIPKLPYEKAAKKATLLWEALREVDARAFSGTYSWFYMKHRSHDFDAAFVRRLNDTAWVPGRDGTFQAPHSILFEETGWTENAFLLSKINFKPPIIAALAREAGIEPGALEFLLKHGVTEAKLKKWLGDVPPIVIIGKKTSFISYVAVELDEEEPDPDGMEQKARMALEERAIQLILSQEPELKRTPPNNRGFDLVEHNLEGKEMRWVEVKSMSGDFASRPVTLSKKQFEWAQQHGKAFWLYVVENAASQDAAHVIRIQDPAGKARTFTFDHGWLSVAKQG